MSIERNKELVRRFLDEVVGAGRSELFDEIFSPEIVDHAAAPERRQGIEGLKAVIEFSRQAQPDQRWVQQRMVAEDDLVVVHGVREGTWAGSAVPWCSDPTGTSRQGAGTHVPHPGRQNC